MRWIAAFAAGLACAIALDVVWITLPNVTNFESATDYSLATRAGHLLLMSGLVYIGLLFPVGAMAMLPFGLTFCLLRRWQSAEFAAALAGLAAAAAIVPLLAEMHHKFDQDDISVMAAMRSLFPQALTCGLVGGLVFARASRFRVPFRS